MAAVEIACEALPDNLYRFLEAAAIISDIWAVRGLSPRPKDQYYVSRIALERDGELIWSNFGPNETRRAAASPTAQRIAIGESATLLLPEVPVAAINALLDKIGRQTIVSELGKLELEPSEYTLTPPDADGLGIHTHWAQDRYFDSLREIFDSLEEIAARRGFPLTFGLKIQRYERADGDATTRRVWHPVPNDGGAAAYIPFRLGNHVALSVADQTFLKLGADDFRILETPAGDDERHKEPIQRTPLWSTTHPSVIRHVASLHFRHDLGYGSYFPVIQDALEPIEKKYWLARGRIQVQQRAVFCAPISFGKIASAAWYTVLDAQRCSGSCIRDLLALHYEIRDVFAVLAQDHFVKALAREIVTGAEGTGELLRRSRVLQDTFLPLLKDSALIDGSGVAQTLFADIVAHDAVDAVLASVSGQRPTSAQPLSARLQARPEMQDRLSAVAVQGDHKGRLVTAVYRYVDRRLTREAAMLGEVYTSIKADIAQMTDHASELQRLALNIRVHIGEKVADEITRAEYISQLFGIAGAPPMVIGGEEVPVGHNIIDDGKVVAEAQLTLRVATHYLFGCTKAAARAPEQACREDHLHGSVREGRVTGEWVTRLPFADAFEPLPCTYIKAICFRGDPMPTKRLTFDLVHFLFLTKKASFGENSTPCEELVHFFDPAASFRTFEQMLSATVKLFDIELRRMPVVELVRGDSHLSVTFRGTFSPQQIAADVAAAVVTGETTGPHLRVMLADALGRGNVRRTQAGDAEVVEGSDGAKLVIDTTYLTVSWGGSWATRRRMS